MIGSIERVLRHVNFRPVLPTLALVIAWRNPTDPNRKVNGYGGVLPVPAPAATAQPASSARPDTILEQQHREQRAARGRVLYASGRAPQTVPAARADSAKPTCDNRVSQTRPSSSSPNT